MMCVFCDIINRRADVIIYHVKGIEKIEFYTKNRKFSISE